MQNAYEKPSNADVYKSVIEWVRARAHLCPAIIEIKLFGSRARGDHHERSDYDFCVVAPKLPCGEWARWMLQTIEDSPTLCGLDFVLDDGTLPKDLMDAVKREGKVIYEKGKD